MTIDTVDIIRTIRKLLKDNFADSKVMLKDIKTPEPSCFYVRYVAGKEEQTATEYFTDKSTYEIVYFSEEENDTELNEVKDKLKRLLRNPLKVFLYDEEKGEVTENFKIIDIINSSISANENDYFITCLIDIELTENDLSAESSALDDKYDDEFSHDENMEELITNIGE